MCHRKRCGGVADPFGASGPHNGPPGHLLGTVKLRDEAIKAHVRIREACVTDRLGQGRGMQRCVCAVFGMPVYVRHGGPWFLSSLSPASLTSQGPIDPVNSKATRDGQCVGRVVPAGTPIPMRSPHSTPALSGPAVGVLCSACGMSSVRRTGGEGSQCGF